MSFGKNHSNSNNNSAFNQTQNFTGTDNTTGTTDFNQSGTTNASSTPTNPQWVTDLAAKFGGGVNALSGLDPHSFVAGPSALTTQAAGGAAGLTGGAPAYGAAADLARSSANNPALGTAAGFTVGAANNTLSPEAARLTLGSTDGGWSAPIMGGGPPVVSGGKGYDYISNYMDPATNAVVNSTLADFDHSAGLTRAQQDLQLAGSGAFGGSGAALTKAATEDSLARARATTDAGLRTQAFTQALGAASSDADRATQARVANANNYLTNAGIKSNIGLGEQQLEQSAGSQLHTIGAGDQAGLLASGAQLGSLGATQQQAQLAAAQAGAGIAGAQDTTQRGDITTQQQLGDALRAIQQQYASSPLDYQNALNQLFTSLPLSLFQGQTQSGTTNQTGTQNQNTTENQTGTTVGSGTSSGSGSQTGFGFKIGQ